MEKTGMPKQVSEERRGLDLGLGWVDRSKGRNTTKEKSQHVLKHQGRNDRESPWGRKTVLPGGGGGGGWLHI